jgi:predicted transcriptional regulator
MIIMAMTTTEIATAIDTTPRTLRKFLRAEGAGVGKGSRYALPSSKREVESLRKRFTAWEDARKAPLTDDAPAID